MNLTRKIVVLLLVSAAMVPLNSCFIGVNAHQDHPIFDPNSNHNNDDDYDEYDGFNNQQLNNGVNMVSIDRVDTMAIVNR
jgi:hypothetical protein